MKIAYLPLCSWAAGSCFWPCCSFQRQLQAALLIIYGTAPALLIDSGLYTFGRTVTYEIMNVYTMKMAGVFMITTCTLSLRTGIIPRWMAYLGLVLALFLLLSSRLRLLGPAGISAVGAPDQRVHTGIKSRKTKK